MGFRVRDKVVAYLVRFTGGVTQVAVFDHVDAPEAGTQVPAGTMEEGESPEAACLRELTEESGVTSARILRCVGTYDYVHQTRQELHRRHVFLVTALEDLPETWTHVVTGPGLDRDMPFRFFWLPAEELPTRLAGEQGAYLEDAVMRPNFRAALQRVTADLQEDPRINAALLYGSAQDGTAGAHSDLDMALITCEDLSWHEGRVIDGVEVELNFSPIGAVRDRLVGRNAITVRAFSSGSVLFDRTAALPALQHLARTIHTEGRRPLSATEVLRWRHRLSDTASDLNNLMGQDDVSARLVAGVLVPATLEAYCALHSLWGAKPADICAHISGIDADLSAQVADFYRHGLSPESAIRIVDRVLAPFGGRVSEYRTDPIPP